MLADQALSHAPPEGGRADAALPRTWPGEWLRWYLTRARHPLKAYIVGHYWSWFARRRRWIQYDDVSVISVSLDDYLQQRIFFDGFYERPLVDWLKRSLRQSDVFWDVGANIGAISLVAARFCDRVVAFEPEPSALELLGTHVQVNRLANVTIVPCALGDRDTTATIHQGPSSNLGMSSLMRQGNEGPSATIKVAQADAFVSDQPWLQPTVIKIDVEGAEHLVLRGAHNVLRSPALRAIVFEDRRSPESEPTNRALVECLHSAGYRIDPFGLSDAQTDDGMYNFLATPTT